MNDLSKSASNVESAARDAIEKAQSLVSTVISSFTSEEFSVYMLQEQYHTLELLENQMISHLKSGDRNVFPPMQYISLLPLIKKLYTLCVASQSIRNNADETYVSLMRGFFKMTHNFQALFREKFMANVTEFSQNMTGEDMENLFEIVECHTSLDIRSCVPIWTILDNLIRNHTALCEACNFLTAMRAVLAYTEKMLTSISKDLAPQVFSSQQRTVFDKKLQSFGHAIRTMILFVKAVVAIRIVARRRNQNEEYPEEAATITALCQWLCKFKERQMQFSKYKLDWLQSHMHTCAFYVVDLVMLEMCKLHGGYFSLTPVEITTEWKLLLYSCMADCLITNSETFLSDSVQREGDLVEDVFSLLQQFNIDESNAEVMSHHLHSITVSISARICGLKMADYNRLEECLYKNLFSPSVLSFTLVSDLFCYMCRYGTTDLCWSHVRQLAVLLNRADVHSGHQSSHRRHPLLERLGLLLFRLVALLSPRYQMEYLQLFPLAQHCTLWRYLPLGSLVPETFDKAILSILAYGGQLLDVGNGAEFASDQLDLLDTLCTIVGESEVREASNSELSAFHERLLRVSVAVCEANAALMVSHWPGILRKALFYLPQPLELLAKYPSVLLAFLDSEELTQICSGPHQTRFAHLLQHCDAKLQALFPPSVKEMLMRNPLPEPVRNTANQVSKLRKVDAESKNEEASLVRLEDAVQGIVSCGECGSGTAARVRSCLEKLNTWLNRRL